VFHWRLIALALMAVLLLLGGLGLLILPDRLEGAVLYDLDEEHAVTALDGLGLLFLTLGSLTALATGILWQRRMDAAAE
jgi:hypothetical protein